MIEVEDMIGIILIMIGRMTEIETEMVAVDQMIDLDLEIMITGIEEDNDLSIFAKMTNLNILVITKLTEKPPIQHL